MTDVVDDHLRLAPAPESAKRARRFVREVLSARGRDDWVERAELAVSELVTNAVLHAHTPIELTAAVDDEQLLVRVRDYDPLPPVPRNYDEDATTGRGMGLVAALTQGHGVEKIDEGKVAWFLITDATLEPDDAPAAWALDDWEASSSAAATVVLREVPVVLWLAARQHHDALIRELVLYLAEHDDVHADVTAADHARTMISTAVVSESDARPDAAVVDVPLELDHERAEWFARLRETLDLGEQLAMAGELFTPPGLPEIVAVRNWACEAVAAQIAGAPPEPWPGLAGTPLEATPRTPDDQAAWDGDAIARSDQLLVAADERNRIVAVSEPLASWLGWDQRELVGRRVLTIVPDQYREAHIAGFTRYLTTGEARILGQPVHVRALHRDGRHLSCSLVVRAGDTRGGASGFIADFRPVGSGDP